MIYPPAIIAAIAICNRHAVTWQGSAVPGGGGITLTATPTDLRHATDFDKGYEICAQLRDLLIKAADDEAAKKLAAEAAKDQATLKAALAAAKKLGS